MHKLILLTLPIGNHDDITLRALNCLKEKNLFAVEDTRSFKDLLRSLQIHFSDKKIISFFDHSDESKAQRILENIDEQDLVVCSEAGSPYISDPAYPLVKKAIEQNIEIDIIPGVSAVTSALELSGLPPTPFHFHGFLPRESGARKNYLLEQASSKGTHLYFEGVSRIHDSLRDLHDVYPQVSISVMKEMTKTFQTVYRFNSSVDSEFDFEQVDARGEFVVAFCQTQDQQLNSADISEIVNRIFEQGAKPKLISKLLSKLSGVPNKECYERISSKLKK